MEELIAHKKIDNDEIYFILVEESYSDNDEAYTLYIHENHYSPERAERSRIFFHTRAEAFEHCEQQYQIAPDEWQWDSEIRFTETFQFRYGVHNRGITKPYLAGFEEGKVVFRLGEREIGSGGKTAAVLHIAGDREGLRRLAALLLLCAKGEDFDSRFHIHLEDEEGFILPDVPVTLHNPTDYAGLRRSGIRDSRGVTKTIYRRSKDDTA